MNVAWYCLILICLFAYVVLDGYDLGAGTISLFQRDRRTRHEIVEKVGAVWDGNETWLVLLGVSLWAGFPLAFGVILPDLYLPLIVALFGLILRGFSVEMISQRGHDAPPVWYWLFGAGSLVSGFCQGFALGSLTSPVGYEGALYQGTSFGAFTWYSVLMGFTVTLGYVAMGFAYLKFHGVGHQTAVIRGGAITGVLAVCGGIAALASVGATAAGINLGSAARVSAFVIALVFAAFGVVLSMVTLFSRRHTFAARAYPYAGLVIATAGVLLAFVISHAPLIVPPSLTIDSAQSPNSTYLFLFIGIGFNIPLLAYYNWLAHRTLLRTDAVGVPIPDSVEEASHV